MIAAAVGGVFSLAGLIDPAGLAVLYGVSADALLLATGRPLLASYLGFAILNWLARDVRDPAARRAIAIANFASWGLSLAVMLVVGPSVVST